jgi:protein involved in polysaccharide export with SLBB domain
MLQQRWLWRVTIAVAFGLVMLLAAGTAGAQFVPGSNPLTSGNAAISGAATPTTPSVPGLPTVPGLSNGQGRGAQGNANPGDAMAGNTPADDATTSDALSLPGARNALESAGRDPFGRKTAKAGKSKTSAGERDEADSSGQHAARDVRRAPFTEFQKYVFETTGQSLPIFGANLFAVGGDFRAIETVPVPADYVLGPGDEVVVRIWGMIEAEFRLAVDREGQVNIPKVGVFSLLGVKAVDLESALRAQIGRSFTNFHLSATLGRLRSMQVYVVGQAARPGLLTTSSLSTFISAVFESGGPLPTGSLRAIELRREGKVLGTLDLYGFLVHGDKSADVRLLPGDVIVIPPAGPSIAVLGPIAEPAIFELKGAGESLQSALTWAGGTTALTSLQKAQLERIDATDARAPRRVESIALDVAGLATALRDGDVVTLFKPSPAFSNAVTLRGNVAAPLRYPFKPGMKLSDLIPDRDALVTPDYFLRKNVMVQFESHGKANQSARVQSDVRQIVDELNWDYAVIERLDRDRLVTRLIPFDLGSLVLRKDPAADLPLVAGDVVTIFSIHDIRVPRAKRSIYVRVEGEVQRPGIYPMRAGDSLLTVIEIAGGLTTDAYLYGAEFTREEARRSQEEQMKKAVSKLEAQALAGLEQQSGRTAIDSADAAQFQARQQVEMTIVRERIAKLKDLKATGRVNLGLEPRHASLAELPGIPLEDADRIFIPPRPAFIQVLGSVNIESALLWQKDRDVGHYLRQAGLAQFADKGAIFVIRADGSVADAESSGFGGIKGMEVQPGDTIVVPEVPDKATGYDRAMRTLKDIAVIFQGFGIGVAALKAVGL